MTKRLADLVLEDMRRPVSEHERFPDTAKDVPTKRERPRIFETRNPITGQVFRKPPVKK